MLYVYSRRQCDDPLWYYICTVRDSAMIHCDTIYVQSETVWWSTVIHKVSQWIITVSDCTYIVSQWIITLPLTVHIQNHSGSSHSLWLYIYSITVDHHTVMIHCDTIYVQSERVWWFTVILYMYSQRQCDDPLWYCICSQRQCDDPLWYYIYIYYHSGSSYCLWLCIYSITVDHRTVSNCTYIVSQWIITLSLTVHI
jgi:hypothetical protein